MSVDVLVAADVAGVVVCTHYGGVWNRVVGWVGDIVPKDGGGEEVGGWVEVVLYV
jgi:hypothetical protein